MREVTIPVLITAITKLLTEAYAGPPDPRSTWFIDNEPNSGILGILAGVSAEEASTSVDGSGETGTTIASHAEHLRWSLAMMNAAIRGEPFQGSWKESWRLIQADPLEWDRLRDALRAEYDTLQNALKIQFKLAEEEYLIGLLALLPHAGYHLGNLRQMIERVRA